MHVLNNAKINSLYPQMLGNGLVHAEQRFKVSVNYMWEPISRSESTISVTCLLLE